MTWPKYKLYIKGTMINMLFLLHPTISKSTMYIFTCTYIDGIPYLDIHMEDECLTGDHWKYLTSVAIPAFIVWGIGLPILAFARLVKRNMNEQLYE